MALGWCVCVEDGAGGRVRDGTEGDWGEGGACEAARGGARKRKRTVFFALAAGGGEGSRGVAGFGARAGRTTHLPVLVIGPVFFRGPRPGNLRGRLVPGRHPARTERFLDHAQQPLNGCFYLPSTRSARVSVAGVPRALVRAAPCVRSRPGRTRCARPRALRRRRASRSASPRNADPVRPRNRPPRSTRRVFDHWATSRFARRTAPRISGRSGGISSLLPRSEKAQKCLVCTFCRDGTG